MSIDFIEKLTPAIVVNSGIFLFSFLCPGFLLWYMLEPRLVVDLDFVKLLILSLAVSAPTFIIPYMITALIGNLLPADKAALYGDYTDWYMRHGVCNALNMYTVVMLCYWFGLGWKEVSFVVAGTIVFNAVWEVYLLFKFMKDPTTAFVLHFARPRKPSD